MTHQKKPSKTKLPNMNQIKTLIISNEISKANKGLWDSSDITNKNQRQYAFTVMLEKLEAVQCL